MRLQLYMLRELMVNFLLSAAFVYFVCCVGVVLQAFASMGVPLLVALKNAPLFLFLVSDILTPLAFLVSVLFTYGRMSAESEFVAVRACGIHPLKVLVPTIVLGLILAGAQFRILSDTIPTMWVQRNKLTQEIAIDSIKNLDPGKSEFAVPKANFYMRWDRRDGLSFDHVYLKFEPPAGSKHRPMNGVAERVTIFFDATAVWLQIEGFRSSDGNLAMTIDPLVKLPYKELVPESSFEAKIRFQRTDSLIANAVRAEERLAEGPRWAQEKRRALIEVQRRAAWSFCALAFGLLGAPIALWLRRGTRLAAVVVAVGIVFVVFFPLAKLGDALADVQSVPPWLAAWLAIGVVSTISGGLVYRLCTR